MSLLKLRERLSHKKSDVSIVSVEEVPEKREKNGLFVLETKPSEEDGLVDIVAVHGLGGDAYGTWSDVDRFWLRDFLPSQIPRARIMTYGYDSVVAFSKSTAGIEEFAKDLLTRLSNERDTSQEKARPVIFICHSLGGLVVKKALVIAHERLRLYGPLLDRINGIAFMGTPHRGASAAFWASLVADVLYAANLGLNTNKDLVKALKKDSKTLADISKQFIERGAQFPIVSFFETEKFESLNCLIVEESSACLGWPNETPVPIQGNHRDMCKFSDVESQKYRPIWKSIKTLAESALSQAEEAKEDSQVIATPVPLSESEIRCLQSLCLSDYDGHKQSIVNRVEGTCTWFLDHRQYRSWLEEDQTSLLWVSGDAGCGKSVLSSFLIDELKSTMSPPANVCFFFCDDKVESQKDAKAILSGLLHQILSANHSLIRHAVAVFEKKGSRTTGELSALWDIFAAVAADPAAGNIVCVIDALDECEESSRNQLLRWFVPYLTDRPASTSSDSPTLRVLMTSRPYESIERIFHRASNVRLKAEDETESISADITAVIKQRLDDLEATTGCSKDTRTKIEQKLVANADRTFLWVSVVLELLGTSPNASEEAFLERAAALPEQLDDVYNAILQRRPEKPRVKRALSIIVTAIRPLTLAEVNVALNIRATDESEEELERRLEFSMERSIKRLCGPFVRITDSKVYLVHQTAKEFLLMPSDAVQSDALLGKYCLESSTCESDLASACIWYLFFRIFEEGGLVLGDKDDLREQVKLYTAKHDFLDYAARHWATHFQRCQPNEDAALTQAIYRLCDVQSQRFRTWYQVFWTSISTDARPPRDMTMIMVAAYFGHKAMVRQLLDDKVDVLASDSCGWTALHWAAWRGQGIGVVWDGDEAIKPLVDAGADVKAQDVIGKTALHWAAQEGQVGVARVLMQAANNNTSPLAVASKMARYLLEEATTRPCL